MRKLIKIPLYILGIFAIGMLSGHLTFKILSMSRTVTVPKLTGRSMIEVNDMVRQHGLYIRLEGEDYDANIPQGYIMRQDIPPTHTVKEGREIRVVLSKGPRVKYVPDVVGQSVEAAETILKEKGIRIAKVIYVHSENKERNIILAQRPEPNEKGAESFNIMVSLGDYDKEEK